MVRNGHSVIIFPKWLLSNITYGTKWLWCKIHMVRNGYGAKYIWYKMVSGYGTKLQFCGTKWSIMVRNGNGTKWLWYEMTSFAGFGILHIPLIT
jgi:hypothetical protein